MSNVVPMKPQRRKRPDRAQTGESAEILFFTGVRYVQLLDEEETADAAMAAAEASAADEGCILDMVAERLQA